MVVVAIASVCTMAMMAGACAKSSAPNASNGTTPATGGAGSDVTIAPTSPPKAGGKITYGLEAETDGWNPTRNRWAISGTMIGLAVFDPLAATDDKGVAQPYLAESFTPNATFTEWLVKVRPNVKFHDGTPLTSAAVKAVLEGHLKSALTKPATGPMQSVEIVDDLTAKVIMASPWAVFPGALTGQLGVVPSPGTIADETGNTTIVGTGPFKYVSWDKNAQFVTEKNQSYWRQGLPYLDGVTFRVLTDNKTRLEALNSNAIQMYHTTDGPTITQVRQDAAAGKLQLVEDKNETEEGFVMLNNEKPPFDDVIARRAVAYATNAGSYVNFVGDGVNPVADGAFTPNSPWYVKTDYPQYNLDKAKELVNQYKASHGGEFKFGLGVGGPDSRKNGEFLADLYKQAGMDVNVLVDEQGGFIVGALAGNYQANLWRQFGAPDPDADTQWWQSTSTLNFARFKSAKADDALKRGRESNDPAVRKQAYADLQNEFASQVPYVWLDHTTWVIVANNSLRDITNGPLPDGKASQPIGGSGFPGVHRLTQVWIQ